MGKFNINAVE